jgi:hypothetical protein
MQILSVLLWHSIHGVSPSTHSRLMNEQSLLWHSVQPDHLSVPPYSFQWVNDNWLGEHESNTAWYQLALYQPLCPNDSATLAGMTRSEAAISRPSCIRPPCAYRVSYGGF